MEPGGSSKCSLVTQQRLLGLCRDVWLCCHSHHAHRQTTELAYCDQGAEPRISHDPKANLCSCSLEGSYRVCAAMRWKEDNNPKEVLTVKKVVAPGDGRLQSTQLMLGLAQIQEVFLGS